MINGKLLRRLEALEAMVAERLREPIEMVIDFVEPGGEITESITVLMARGRKARGRGGSLKPAQTRCGRNSQ